MRRPRSTGIRRRPSSHSLVLLQELLASKFQRHFLSDGNKEETCSLTLLHMKIKTITLLLAGILSGLSPASAQDSVPQPAPAVSPPGKSTAESPSSRDDSAYINDLYRSVRRGLVRGGYPQKELSSLFKAAEAGSAEAYYFLAEIYKELYKKLGQEHIYTYSRSNEPSWWIIKARTSIYQYARKVHTRKVRKEERMFEDDWRWGFDPVPTPVIRLYEATLLSSSNTPRYESASRLLLRIAADLYYQSAVLGCEPQGIGKSPKDGLNDLYRSYKILPSYALRKSDVWEKAAGENHDALAQYYLGLCYLDGWGCTRNAEEAEKWLRLAAAQGLDKAEAKIRMCNVRGWGAREQAFNEYRERKRSERKGDFLLAKIIGLCLGLIIFFTIKAFKRAK